MNLIPSALLCVASLHLVCVAGAQGTFQNRGFESANLQPIPSGQYGGLVPIAAAFPGWVAYAGTNPITQVLQNNETLGGVNVSIFGPNWTGSAIPIITGRYTALFQAGFDGSGIVEASLAQTGLVPPDAQFIQCKAWGQNLAVSFAGQSISLTPVGSGPNYTLYGGDISSFAGKVGELRFSSEPTADNPYNTLGLDSINFVPIPEPGVGALCLFGALVLGLRLRRRLAKRKQRL